MLRSLVGSEMCIRDSISTVYLHEALKLNFANLTINVNKKEKKYVCNDMYATKLQGF